MQIIILFPLIITITLAIASMLSFGIDIILLTMIDFICIATENILLFLASAEFSIFMLVPLFTFTIVIIFVSLVMQFILMVVIRVISAF
jgi:hypothetical protein